MPWVAWPPSGQVPIQALSAGFGGSVDKTGWSVQSDTIDLSSAQVSVTSSGMNLAVSVTQLGSGYGSILCAALQPDGVDDRGGADL